MSRAPTFFLKSNKNMKILFFIMCKGERSSEFYETLFELEGVRNEEKGAFWEQNISLALLYNIEAISETSLSCSAEILRF